MEYDEALAYLHSFVNYEKEISFAYPEAFKLDRMRQLAKELGNPQNAYESVIIAGSKGKGSAAAILSSILRMENRKVGLYTSPHLVDLRERIQVNGLLISAARLTELALRLKNAIASYAWRKDPPTFFEIITALAFCHFKDLKVQIAVLEVGLGGLYDSTNIANAKVVGVTPISLEHTDKLGKTVSKIAVQKCGIIKGREIVVSGPQTPEAEAVIADAVSSREAKLVRVGHEIKITEREFGEDFQRFDLRASFGHFRGLELGLRGSHQIENAAIAVGLAKGLEAKTRLSVSEGAVRQGVLDARWPGRLEKVRENPKVILDGAHNAESARRMMEGVSRHFAPSRVVAVVGAASDKDLPGILKELAPVARFVIGTSFDSPRALSAEAVSVCAQELGLETMNEPKAGEALKKAVSMARKGEIVLVTGSLYLIGEVKRFLECS